MITSIPDLTDRRREPFGKRVRAFFVHVTSTREERDQRWQERRQELINLWLHPDLTFTKVEDTHIRQSLLNYRECHLNVLAGGMTADAASENQLDEGMVVVDIFRMREDGEIPAKLEGFLRTLDRLSFDTYQAMKPAYRRMTWSTDVYARKIDGQEVVPLAYYETAKWKAGA